MTTRAKLLPINGYTTLIDDGGYSTAYLVCGRERAVLIDTLNGTENLAHIVRTVTDLPIVVVNTHGHLDHIGGNHFFSEAFLHRADLPIYQEHLGYLKALLQATVAAVVPTGEECQIRFLEPGAVLDLGGVALEVVAIPGHTPGSIALLDRAARLLYTGDAINGGTWMHLDHSLPFSAYLESLNALDPLRPAFGGLYGGHVQAAVPMDPSIIDRMKKGVAELLAGDRTGDETWEWQGKTAGRHPLGDGLYVTYDPDRVE